MKSRILLLALAIVGLDSCSTMYKSGQTPDDVYYSPAPQFRSSSADDYADNNNNGDDQNDYVNVQTDQDRSAYNSEDNYLRMKVRNRSMWSSLDDYSMYDAMYSPYYGSSFGMGFGNSYSMYNPYSFYSPYNTFGYGGLGMGLGFGGYYGFNNFYNPYSMYNPYYGYGGGYYGGGFYYPTKDVTPRPAGSYRPRTYNLGSYGTRTTNNPSNTGRNAPVRVFRNNNNTYVTPNSGRSSSGNDGGSRRSYNSGNDSRPSRTFDQPSRSSSPSPSYTPSSSGSRSSGSGGGGGSAPSRSPGRGGR